MNLSAAKKYYKTAIVFLAGLLAGWLVHGYSSLMPNDSLRDVFLEERKSAPEYPFINPLIECEMGESITVQPLESFKGKVEDLIEGWKAGDKSRFVAVYFRSLNDGPSFGINEKERFLPGSLLKVPTMMGYLKKAENDGEILKKNIRNTLDEDAVPFQSIAPSKRLQKGREYTVDELINRMIRYSDNAATGLLNMNGGIKLMEGVLDEFGLPKDQPITVKQYASFFRVLYNSSFLEKKYSNHALGLLVRSEFRDGIVAGLPEGTLVAHKFGEQAFLTDLPTDEYNWAQLHDCGIIYYPGNPYLLCVMTRGRHLEELAPVIAEISRLVHKNIDMQMIERGYLIKH